ncbi:phosphate ABC transporter substrate-binding protein (PhoT family) [Paraburkholderia sp. RAU2J]|uniref:phosphate ABC transporter substrate-binding protein PstS n=1 Tax=Paraburkholderia sp. RAU2J TaxID=1938810 RepID=UPI000EB31959|nr:phosphate ABC transporter substrate-binding protein PstS [Paraburkholderia sp. RAU2J]RKT26408.1 phosphate ABC transporter substrate-binding protein (PhoT family) [Paraburkholderia sp. RAU2J]
MLTVGLAGALFVNSTRAADISGAGSTFAAPIYTKWASAYLGTGGGKVSYRGIGSTDGVRQIVASQVDFAGTDAPLSAAELAKNGLFQFPTVIGGVVPVVNLPGIKSGELTLTGQVLGDIFLGKIIYWDDPVLVALNPKVKMPDTPIAVVRRLDGSGTTLIWTHFLSQVNPEWKSKVGEGTSVHWPRGIGGKGNEGVATFVKILPGAIGYVAWDFTKQNHMSYVAMDNASGVAVQPGPETFKAAVASADWSKSLVPILTNEPGKNAWPVVGATFVLLHSTPAMSQRGDETLKFFDWALANGRQAAEDLDYVPLPAAVVDEVRAQLRSKIRSASGKAISAQ